MKLGKGNFLSSVVIALGISATSLFAQTDSLKSSSETGFNLEDNFQTGRMEIKAAVIGDTVGDPFKDTAGPALNPMIKVINRPTVDYSLAYGQLGFMVSDVAGKGFWRGNLEMVPEAFAAGIYENTGHYIAGGTFWIRYNFVPHHWRVVPYAQVGGGVTLTDMSHQYTGQNFNFNVDAAAGLRYFIRQGCSLNLEYRFQHISNANLGRHNLGTNAQGPVLGFSWLF